MVLAEGGETIKRDVLDELEKRIADGVEEPLVRAVLGRHASSVRRYGSSSGFALEIAAGRLEGLAGEVIVRDLDTPNDPGFLPLAGP